MLLTFRYVVVVVQEEPTNQRERSFSIYPEARSAFLLDAADGSLYMLISGMYWY